MSFGVGSRQNIGILSGMMTWSFIDRIGDMIGEDLSLSLSDNLVVRRRGDMNSGYKRHQYINE